MLSDTHKVTHLIKARVSVGLKSAVIVPPARSHLPCLPSSLQPLRPSLSPHLVILLYLFPHGLGLLIAVLISLTLMITFIRLNFHDTFWS